jgi:lysophospholipase L1-like esterase
MIHRRTRLNAPACFNGGRKFIAPGHAIFISLLLASLLSLGCARPGATTGQRASRLVYVAIGDSTGIGLGARDGGGYVERLFARMEQKRSGAVLLNLSAAGATTADALNKQLPRLDGTGANLVTICVGLNDLLRGREAGEFAGDYDALVTRLKQPGRLIVLTNLPDVASAPALREMDEESLRLRLGQFNKAIEEIAGRHKTPLVDLYRASVESAGSRPEFFSSDGLHPSEPAYARWAEEMWTVLEPAMHE